MRIEHSVQVNAPAAAVWDVITDLARYPEWNPFVVACESDLAVGSPIVMRVRLVGPPLRQRETILAHDPGRRLCYGLAGAALGAIVSERCHVVTSLDAGRAQYDSRFELRGWLAPLVRGLLGRRLVRGFSSMTEALVRRAETRTS